jgi:predicted ATPase
LIGREAELAAVIKLLGSENVRVLTLLGPGGIGKTRLALQAAAELIEQFVDGVYFIDLAPIRDPQAVPSAIAQILGLKETSDRPMLEELKAQLREKKMLLLLDNFEQVTSAASIAAELLRDCAHLSLLVTSREALRLRGEHVFPVPSLGLPKARFKQLLPEQLTQYDALRLFIERAQSVQPDFSVTNENAPAVAEICWRLDGLPLAIELAAARIRLFTPQALLERLGSRMKFLRGGARDLPARQQTLRDAIDWSYEMLDEGEQRLFELLSVFQGCTIEATETIAGGIELLVDPDMDVLEILSSLVDKSLVRQVSLDSGEPRLLMLETIREFAAEKLEEQIEFRSMARLAQAVYYADFTQRQWIRLTGSGREAALTELILDIENLRTAWNYWVEEKNLEQLGKFIDSLWLLYDARGWYHSLIDLITDMLSVLSSTPATPERIQQEILLQTGLARALQVIKGYTADVERAYTRALELSREVGEIPELFPVLRGLGSLYGYLGDYQRAGELSEKILSMADRLADPDMQAEGHLRVGYTVSLTSDLHAGLEHLDRAIAGYDPRRYATPRFNLGANSGVIGLNVSALLLWMAGFPERALERANAGISLARRLNHPYSLAYALFHTGLLHIWWLEPDLARDRSQEVLEIAGEHDFQVWGAVATCLHGAALAGMNQAEEGLILVRRGIDSYQGLKTPPVFWPLLLFIQAEVCRLAGKYEMGLSVLEQAMTTVGPGGQDILGVEFYRLAGDLLLALYPQDPVKAEQSYLQALAIAREKQAAMLELRATVRLCRLWQDQGKGEEVKQMLRPLFEKFSEGFATVDLKEARALLD